MDIHDEASRNRQITQFLWAIPIVLFGGWYGLAYLTVGVVIAGLNWHLWWSDVARMGRKMVLKRAVEVFDYEDPLITHNARQLVANFYSRRMRRYCFQPVSFWALPHPWGWGALVRIALGITGSKYRFKIMRVDLVSSVQRFAEDDGVYEFILQAAGEGNAMYYNFSAFPRNGYEDDDDEGEAAP